MAEDDDDLSLDIELRPLDEVAARLVILSGLIQLALTEIEADTATAAAERADVIDALRIGEASGHLSPAELSMVRLLEVGSLGDESTFEIIWQVEAIAALGWAANLLPNLNDPWTQANFTELTATIPAPWEELDPFIAQLRLRAEFEIAAARETAELWAWRTELEAELTSSDRREREELVTILRETATEAAQLGLLKKIGDDFGIGNQPFSEIAPQERATIAEIAYQRLRALNWLCGFGASWDDVPLDL